VFQTTSKPNASKTPRTGTSVRPSTSAGGLVGKINFLAVNRHADVGGVCRCKNYIRENQRHGKKKK